MNKRVCPLELAGGLDNRIRRLIQNPQKILMPYIHEGMIVIDLGCGPGFFTIETAKMLNGSGKVIAADLQAGMLKKVTEKIKGTDLEPLIEIHQCGENETGLKEKADFILAFYVIHEIPGQHNLFNELKTILKPDGKMLIVEPDFHVSGKSFDEMLEKLKNTGFKILERPKMFLSRCVVLGI